MTKNERWILSEFQVARDRIGRFREKLLFHRHQTPYAEVDLVFVSGPRLRIFEVKTIQGEFFASKILGRNQARRLLRARDYFEDRFEMESILNLAVVSHARGPGTRPEIRYFDSDAGWLLTW